MAANVKVVIQGHSEIKLNCKLIPEVMGRGYNAGLQKAMDYLLAKSQELVPVDTGDLKRSGKAYVTGTGQNSRGWVAYLMYYSVYVHEDLTKYHDHPTQAKFLEQPAREHRKYMMEIIRREIARHMGGSFGSP